ncbi:YkgJ family cysteine cluster protein [Desulfosediminicola flagellatus]|uniref:YkgJ family cysteine cluster protein n=1 Tax=Desulfosediminicola flagellatus TaxID=2569541 RepID=UPI0010AD1434|nr:YkgJ family cysteine cluster protein [Desulfosediminicola flagellatus]
MPSPVSHHSHIDEPSTWIKFTPKLCGTCNATCCKLPVEVTARDLIRMQYMDEFELEENPKTIAKRLKKEGVIEHFYPKKALFTLTRMANGDCLFLDKVTRRCTMYHQRPDTCRNHPRIGPRSGFCAYIGLTQ